MHDMPASWEDAIARAAPRRRILVLGATDMGKSSFIRAYAAAMERPVVLIDLDPGQKMIGPPGTAGYGFLDTDGSATVKRFRFLGSTGVGSFSLLAAAASQLAGEADRPFIVNTPGYVRGPGARLQAMIRASIAPDLVVEISEDPGAAPILPPGSDVATLRLPRSPLARRKSAGMRAAIRQAAFAEALSGAGLLSLSGPRFEPAPIAPFVSAERPVCALTDAEGNDLALGIAEAVTEEASSILAPAPPRTVAAVRLGRMWAAPRAGGWTLLERLAPSWIVDAGPS